MDSADPDYMLVEGEAEKVAKDAVKALKYSRRECSSSRMGIPTWTGRNGALNSPKKSKYVCFFIFYFYSSLKTNTLLIINYCWSRLKFGNKKNTKLFENKSNNKKEEIVVVKSALEENEDIFSGKKTDELVDENPSSSTILGRILQRSKTLPNSDSSSDEDQPGYSGSNTNLTNVTPELEDLISDIRSYIAFQARVDGQATTDELLAQFKDKLPPKNAAVFKSMLNKICTFHREVSNDGVWILKPEFRWFKFYFNPTE